VKGDQQVSCCLPLRNRDLLSGVICDHAIRTTSDRRCPVFKNNSKAKRCLVLPDHFLRNSSISSSVHDRIR